MPIKPLNRNTKRELNARISFRVSGATNPAISVGPMLTSPGEHFMIVDLKMATSAT